MNRYPKKIMRIFPVLWLFSIFFSFASAEMAIPQIAVGKLTYTEGRVDLLKLGTERAVLVREGEYIYPGNIIRTKSFSKAEIAFLDKTILRLAPNSVVKIEEYLFDDKGRRRKGSVNLARGKIRMIVAKSRSSSPFIVNTPNASGKIKGSDIFAFYQIQSTGMLIVKGNLALTGTGFPDGTINLPAGTTVMVPWGKKPGRPRFYFDVERKRFEIETSPTKKMLIAKRKPQEEEEDEEAIFGYTPAESTLYAGTAAIGAGTARRAPEAAEEPFSRPVTDIYPLGTSPGGSYTLFTSSGLFDEGGFFSGAFSGAIAAGTTSGLFTFDGGYTGSETAWLLQTNGTSNDGGEFYGWMAGNRLTATWDSFFSGLYVDGSGTAGYLTGNLSGTHGSPMIGEGTLTLDPIGPITLTDTLVNSLSESLAFEGEGLGIFEGGGTLEASNIGGTLLGIEGQNWGIWKAEYEGSYTGTTSPWTLAVGASTTAGKENWLGTIKGLEDTDWSAGELSGTFKGCRMKEVGENITISAMSGEVLGTYEEDSAWQAAGTGAWIEVSTFEAAALGYDDIGGLDSFVSIPVTETYASLLTGIGTFDAGGVLEGTMDTTFFTNGTLADMEGVWTALISGAYTGSTGDAWSLDLNNGGDTVTITGSRWSGDTWQGEVTGSRSGGTDFTGAVGGTYDSDSFSGVGSGVWETPMPTIDF